MNFRVNVSVEYIEGAGGGFQAGICCTKWGINISMFS